MQRNARPVERTTTTAAMKDKAGELVKMAERFTLRPAGTPAQRG